MQLPSSKCLICNKARSAHTKQEQLACAQIKKDRGRYPERDNRRPLYDSQIEHLAELYKDK